MSQNAGTWHNMPMAPDGCAHGPTWAPCAAVCRRGCYRHLGVLYRKYQFSIFSLIQERGHCRISINVCPLPNGRSLQRIFPATGFCIGDVFFLTASTSRLVTFCCLPPSRRGVQAPLYASWFNCTFAPWPVLLPLPRRGLTFVLAAVLELLETPRWT